MPCAECGRILDWCDIYWHPCEGDCVDDATWVARLASGQLVQCSRSRDGSYWFFYCRGCKDASIPTRVLRGAMIVKKWYGAIDYENDLENDSDSS